MNCLSGRSLVKLSVAASLIAIAGPLAAPLAAQVGAIVQPTPQTGAVDRLNQNLNRLSRQPTDMDALIGAGEASYQLGDAQAANGFFMRADMVNARDGRVKLGLALVSVALKQPREAAAYFDEAEALGARADGHMFERALTYDLTGQQDKAQRDYVQQLRAAPGNSEVIRAYAVSLGISGKVDLAEAQLRPLLFRSDRAAWRDRTMILAMNGRTAEARRIAQTIMPRSLADAMEPYLIRMGSLTAPQKAAATYYGQFPADGLRLATVTAPPAAPRPEPASTPRRRSRDRGKPVAAPAPANPPEDSRLIAAMPRGDMPPPMVQPLPSRVPQPVFVPAPAARATPAPAPSAADDDPDGWTVTDVRRAQRRSTLLPVRNPVSSAPVRTALAPASPTSAPSVFGSAAVPVRPSAGMTANAVPVAPMPVPARPAPTTPIPASAAPVSPAPFTPTPSPPTPTPSAAIASTPAPVPATPVPTALAPVTSAAPQASVLPAPATPTPQAVHPTPTPAPIPQPNFSAAPLSAPVQGPPSDPAAPSGSTPPASTTPVPAPAPAVGPPAESAPAPTASAAAVPDTAPQPGFSTAPVAGDAPVKPPRTLAAIMADIKVSEEERATPPQAVDLAEVARLQAARRKAAADKAKKDALAKAKAEADAKAKAEAEEKARLKANPERLWVQVATGRDTGALAFDMRRLRKTYSVLAGEDGWTAEWGATRRLLIGPFTPAKAKAIVTDLKKAGGDGFVWQSEAGEVVAALSGK